MLRRFFFAGNTADNLPHRVELLSLMLLSSQGKIVLFSLGGFCSHAFKVKVIEDAGAVGAIFGEFSQIPPSWDSMAEDVALNPTIGIGVNLVGISVTQFIVANYGAAFSGPNVNKSFTATISYQPDPFFELFNSRPWVVLSVILPLWLGVVAIASAVKFILFVSEQGGLRFSVPQLCLSLTFCAAVMAMLQVLLNPLGARNNTSQLTMIVFRELPSVLWILPTLVFPFYWGELVASTQPVAGLSASRLPFFFAAFLIFALTLAVVIVKGLYGSSRDFIYAQICTVTILAGLAALYFTFQGLRVIFSLARMQEGFTKTAVQRRTTVLFLVLALCLWGFVVSYAASFAPSLGIFTPDFITWLSFFWVYNCISLAIIAYTLSPKSMKEAGVKISAYMSGTASGIASSNSPDVEMSSQSLKKNHQSASDEHIDAQMAGTKVAL